MRDLLLLAASGLAREVAAAVRDTHRVRGILDDDPAWYGREAGGIPVLGTIDSAAASDADLLVCIGSGSGRRGIVERLRRLGVGENRYATVVAAGAMIPTGTVLGAGSVLLAGVVATADVAIGRHVVVMPHATLTHDNVIGDFVTIAAGVALGGSVVIGAGSYLGMNASVRQNVRIGDGATVGMGAVVLQNVPDGETWAHVPARPLRLPGTDAPPALARDAWVT
ncbi:NeuD/PglB/VioB family sugar acetyltransferase [Cryobacterium sp. SO2]|uniref:NeuD/PglB/VioB family sugar acetyltransferase n=1 Tax=Cryobacterium sp. SO2 TaxID=1897060 RepID=UPI00223CB8AB|nr:NeuD/PglB/VioB family sugar acetyltransferase [Cryobacterium sp. SO2]WEO76934.1 NeuD/PglB/VioB family sugar acetyltransferase [Cryobacterium sp. SO2]